MQRWKGRKFWLMLQYEGTWKTICKVTRSPHSAWIHFSELTKRGKCIERKITGSFLGLVINDSGPVQTVLCGWVGRWGVMDKSILKFDHGDHYTILWMWPKPLNCTSCGRIWWSINWLPESVTLETDNIFSSGLKKSSAFLQHKPPWGRKKQINQLW